MLEVESWMFKRAMVFLAKLDPFANLMVLSLGIRICFGLP